MAINGTDYSLGVNFDLALGKVTSKHSQDMAMHDATSNSNTKETIANVHLTMGD